MLEGLERWVGMVGGESWLDGGLAGIDVRSVGGVCVLQEDRAGGFAVHGRMRRLATIRSVDRYKLSWINILS